VGKCLSTYNTNVTNSLTSSNTLTNELPFVSRLRDRTTNNFKDSSKRLFLQRYDLERGIQNALVGKKKQALKLYFQNGRSIRFLKLRLVLLTLIVTPTYLIKKIRDLKRSKLK